METNTKLLTLMSTLGKVAAHAVTEGGATAEECAGMIAVSLSNEIANLKGAKASPATLVNDAFDVANNFADLFGAPKVQSLISQLQQTEKDAFNMKVLTLVGDLVNDYKAIKAIA
jgi:hypothetical protein